MKATVTVRIESLPAFRALISAAQEVNGAVPRSLDADEPGTAAVPLPALYRLRTALAELLDTMEVGV